MTAVKPRQRDNGKETAQGSSQGSSHGLSLELSPPRPFFPDPELICIALEAGQVGIWSWDIGSNQASWSTNIEDICGLAKGSLDGTRMVLDNDIHPDDRPVVIAAIQAARQRRAPRRVQKQRLRGALA